MKAPQTIGLNSISAIPQAAMKEMGRAIRVAPPFFAPRTLFFALSADFADLLLKLFDLIAKLKKIFLNIGER